MTVVSDIRQITSLTRELAQSQDDEANQRAALNARRSQLQELLTSVRRRVYEGESTGDIALDIQIVLGEKVKKDAKYRAIKDFCRTVLASSGELVVVPGTSMSGIVLARIADDPQVGWVKQNLYFDYTGDGIKISVDRGLAVSLWNGEAEAVSDSIGVSYLLASGGKGYTEEVVLLIGESEIQKWVDKLEPAKALSVLAAARKLGASLEASDELQRHIRDRREGMIPELLKLMETVSDQRRNLERLRLNPGPAMTPRLPQGWSIEPTEDGVKISFGDLKSKLEAAEDRLKTALEKAEEFLQMGDNPTFQEAKQFLESGSSAPVRRTF